MSADRLNSAGIITLRSETFDTNTASGPGTTRVFTGSRALILAQRQVEIGFGATITKVESNGDGNYQLTAGYTWDTSQGGSSAPPNNSHELDNTMSQVDVWNNPKLRANFASAFGSVGAANAAIGYIRALCDQFLSTNDGSATAQAAAEAKINTDYPPGSFPTQNALIKNALRGVAYRQIKNSIQFDSVYRRRITAASYNQVQASFAGAGKIWTTSEVVSFEGTPAAWWFQLPSDYLWLKAAPLVQTVAQQKTEISYSYMAVYEAWDMLYSAYGSATLLSF